MHNESKCDLTISLAGQGRRGGQVKGLAGGVQPCVLP